eukprot:gene9844-20475_t
MRPSDLNAQHILVWYLCINSIAIGKVSLTPKDFLQNNPCGPYTVVPISRGKVLDLPFHVRRLKDSFCARPNQMQFMEEYDDHNIKFSNKLISALSSSLPDSQFSGLATILISITGHTNQLMDSDIKCLFTVLNPLYNEEYKSISVDLQLYTRKSPNLKNSQWIIDRKILEINRNKTSFETIMITKTKNDFLLTEGLISNIFIIENNTLITAGNGSVLEGSMSNIVLNLCKSMNLPYEIRCPSLLNFNTWTGAFMTSCTRPILPIVEMTFSEEIKSTNSLAKHIPNGYITFESIDPIILQLRKELLEILQNNGNSPISENTLWRPLNYEGRNLHAK